MLEKKKATSGERLTKRPWISVQDELPEDKSCVEIE